VRWYYFLSMGHYLHLFVTQFFEPRRKDWYEDAAAEGEISRWHAF
jgi:hypothetical protein